MPTENMMAVRQEILDLLRQQMEVLDSPSGLSEEKLRECYIRQTRVQELREQLQAAGNSVGETFSTSSATGVTPAPPESVTADLYIG
jgi:hypothetical protein